MIELESNPASPYPADWTVIVAGSPLGRVVGVDHMATPMSKRPVRRWLIVPLHHRPLTDSRRIGTECPPGSFRTRRLAAIALVEELT